MYKRVNGGVIGPKKYTSYRNVSGTWTLQASGLWSVKNVRSKIVSGNNSWISPIRTANLTMYLDAGNNASYPETGTAWTDLSGVVNGTLTNGPTFSLNSGGLISFDGTNDFVSIPFASSPFRKSSQITYECWVRLGVDAGKNIMGTSISGGGGSGAIYYGSGTSVSFYWTPSNPGADRTASATLGSTGFNTWKHLVFTMNFSGSGTPQWYENSVARSTSYNASVTTASPVTGYNQSINDYVGGWYANSPTYFQGSIAVVRMYDVALTATEVAAHFNAEKARFGL